MKEIYFHKLSEWKNWLSFHHDKSEGIWMVYYNKQSGKPSINYKDALDEALCWGWIDSIIKKIDDEKYVRKFTPRNEDSKWSEVNKKRAGELIEEKRMTEIGLLKINAAKKNGMWFKNDRPQLKFEMTGEFEQALSKNKNAKKYFESLSKTNQKQFLGWIETAKLPETRNNRIKESIRLLSKEEKLGLK